jgi:hypothetical protein
MPAIRQCLRYTRSDRQGQSFGGRAVPRWITATDLRVGKHRELVRDFGFGQLTDGSAQVVFDDAFSAVVDSDSYHVFLTEYEDNHALYVANRNKNGFTVRAKSGAAAGSFSCRIVAKRKDIAVPRFESVLLPPVRSLTSACVSASREPVPAE